MTAARTLAPRRALPAQRVAGPRRASSTPCPAASLCLRDACQLGAEVGQQRVLVGLHVALPAAGAHGAGSRIDDDARQLDDLLQCVFLLTFQEIWTGTALAGLAGMHEARYGAAGWRGRRGRGARLPAACRAGGGPRGAWLTCGCSCAALSRSQVASMSSTSKKSNSCFSRRGLLGAGCPAAACAASGLAGGSAGAACCAAFASSPACSGASAPLSAP